MQNISLKSMYHWLSYDIVRFKIKVGVEEKCMQDGVASSKPKVNDAITAS